MLRQRRPSRRRGHGLALRTFLMLLRRRNTCRKSQATPSILTITSNIIYGKANGTLADSRNAGGLLSPGAKSVYSAEKNSLLAPLNSVAKPPYEYALDGISNTLAISEALVNLELRGTAPFCRGRIAR